MPRKSLVMFLAILLAAALGISRAFTDIQHRKEMETFERIYREVMENYVEEVEPEQLFKGAYQGMLQSLDPYSQYLDQQESATFAADTEGKFGGLGIEISIADGMLTVVSPIRGTPAYEAGIMAGDVILKIDGKSTERITLPEAVRVLRGEPGTQVVLTVRHPHSQADTDITITRAVINPPSVEYEMADPELGIGLVRINSFSAKVTRELLDALKDLQKQGLKGLILDLRGNPGGLLDKAVEVADVFLDQGVIVSYRGRRPEQKKEYLAHKDDRFESLPLVLVVDGGSASASEILAAALRDHHRALLVGARTYGKGSVQNLIPLGDGAALKLTTARYYTPAGKPIEDRVGIMPDVYVPMPREHLMALRNQEREDKLRGHYRLSGALDEEGAALPGEPLDTGEEPGPPSEREESRPESRRTRVVDYQLRAAFNILKGEIIAAIAARGEPAG